MTAARRAGHSFKFYSKLSVQQALDLKVSNLRQLSQCLRNVPASSIYHHTHGFLQRHAYLELKPTSEFAYWVKNILGEKMLGERLSSIDIFQFPQMESLRWALIHVIETHLSAKPESEKLHSFGGHEFYFLKARCFVLKLPYETWTLKEFLNAIRGISTSSLYHHLFESRLRLGPTENDFSRWLREELHESKLAKKIARLNLYPHSMGKILATLIHLIGERCHE